MIISTLKEYLARIDAFEKQKPEEERRQVPNLTDISKATDIHYTTISRIANNRAKRLDYKTAVKIIDYIRSLGFEMELNDLIDYRSKDE